MVWQISENIRGILMFIVVEFTEVLDKCFDRSGSQTKLIPPQSYCLVSVGRLASADFCEN